jgi:hypothetical protein
MFKWKCQAVWLWVGMFCLPGCHSEFFVDKGHIDHVAGVAFQIKPPHLFIKKAFHLRDQTLSPLQLEQLSEAMPEIAALTDQVLSPPWRPHRAEAHADNVRSVRAIAAIDDATPLSVRAIQNWQIQEGYIAWTTDYFWVNAQGHFENLRDNYAIRKNANTWYFAGHPRSAPEGKLSCRQDQQGWVKCVVPDH